MVVDSLSVKCVAKCMFQTADGCSGIEKCKTIMHTGNVWSQKVRIK